MSQTFGNGIPSIQEKEFFAVFADVTLGLN